MKCYQCGNEINGNFCTNCGASVKQEQMNIPVQPQAANQYAGNMQQPAKKKHTPFYKKPLFIVIAAILIIGILGSVINGIKKSVEGKFKWSDMVLADMLPEPKGNKGNIYDNTEDELHIKINNVSEAEYKKYVGECKEEGYTVDPLSGSSSYKAFNSEGYMLDVDNYFDSMSIELKAPVQFSKIKWPKSKTGKQLPAPESLNGKFIYERNSGFEVMIADTSIDDYNAYTDSCLEKGFDKDYSREERSFTGYNSAGYHISLEYVGNGIMSITAYAPVEDKETEDETTTKSSKNKSDKKDSTSSTDETTTKSSKKKSDKKDSTSSTDETTTKSSKKKSDNIRSDFKNAMDSYESFIDEYVEFMKKYEESDGMDLKLIADYASFMSKYSDMSDAFDEWEDEDLTNEEMAYMLEVEARVSKKLLEIDE